MGFTFTNSLFLLGAGSPIFLLVLAAAVCVVIGMGLPTLGVYVLPAKLIVRGRVEIGITPIAAHLFVLNFGMTPMITPPVAVAAFTAAGIAEADPMRTAVTSVKTGWLAYAIPFVIVFSPGLTMDGDFGLIAVIVAAMIGGIFLVSIAVTGYFQRPPSPLLRSLACLAGMALCIPVNSFPRAGSTELVAAAAGTSFFAAEVMRAKGRI